MSTKNVELVLEKFSSMAAGDLERYFSVLSEDIEFIEPGSLPYGGVYRGHSGVRDLHAQSGSLWEDLRFDVLETFDAGNTVFVKARLRARGIATGVQLDEVMVYLARVKDGKIGSVEIYFDTVRICEALGTVQTIS